MAGRTKIELFPKDAWTREEVDSVRQFHLAHGAKSSTQSEDEGHYILTTIWPVIA